MSVRREDKRTHRRDKAEDAEKKGRKEKKFRCLLTLFSACLLCCFLGGIFFYLLNGYLKATDILA